jgi:hypothetical protein
MNWPGVGGKKDRVAYCKPWLEKKVLTLFNRGRWWFESNRQRVYFDYKRSVIS